MQEGGSGFYFNEAETFQKQLNLLYEMRIKKFVFRLYFRDKQIVFFH